MTAQPNSAYASTTIAAGNSAYRVSRAGRQPDKTFRFIDHSSSGVAIFRPLICGGEGDCMVTCSWRDAGNLHSKPTASSSSAAVSPADHRLVAARGYSSERMP